MSTALPSLAKSELIASEPPDPGRPSGSSHIEQILGALVADDVATSAAVAELAEIAADRDLRLLAFFRPRDDVEHDLRPAICSRMPCPTSKMTEAPSPELMLR